jgi:chemotaxis signal transduction protein
VLPAGELRPLPSPAPGVAGLAEHQGGALPVLETFGPGGHVLVLEHAGERFGLLVEEVVGVVRVRDEEVEPAPAGQHERLVEGILRRDGEQLLVLDAGALRARLGGGPRVASPP